MQFDDDSRTPSGEVPLWREERPHANHAAADADRSPEPYTSRPLADPTEDRVMAEFRQRWNALPKLTLVRDKGTEAAPIPRIADEESLRVCAAELGVLVQEHAVLSKRCDEGDEISCARIALVSIFIAVFVAMCSRYFDGRPDPKGPGVGPSAIESAALDTIQHAPFDDPDVLEALAILVLGEEREA